MTTLDPQETTVPLFIWPPVQIPARPIRVRPCVARHLDDSLIWGPEMPTSAMLPDGYYWRELSDLNLDSLDAIAEHVSVFGLPEAPILPGEPLRKGEVLSVRGGVAYVVPAERVRAAVRELRDTVRAWQAIGLDEDGAPMLSIDELVSSWESGYTVPRKVEDAAQHLEVVLSAGLRDYAPGVSATEFEPDALGLYSEVCLQVFNNIADEHRSWRRCAKCGRLFQRTWRTSSVSFCGLPCAQAAASKRYRDKRREG